ncbi:uncharacterized protein LOC143367993 [Andrena cerasifolii]|uniref:uncharacterized protein LOC143367993 n=1 Tax=Andrena cerasifolii TaxID=2819439 RepID=UPI0040378031
MHPHVGRSAELVSDLCQSRASSLSLFLSLSLSPPSFSISPLSSSTPGFPSRFDVYRVAARPSSRWFSTCPSGPFATRPLVAARPVQIDIHTYHGAGYTYSNTVLQWSYQWGKQKFSSQADVPRGDRRPPRSGSYSGSRCDREPRGSSHEERAPTLSIRDTQDERQQMEHRGAAPDQQEHQ